MNIIDQKKKALQANNKNSILINGGRSIVPIGMISQAYADAIAKQVIHNASNSDSGYSGISIVVVVCNDYHLPL